MSGSASTTDATLDEICVAALADAFRGDGEILCNPIGVVPICGGRLARETGLHIEERPFTRQEMLAAREVFYTSASAFVMPVVEVDGEKVGGGRPGPITKKLRAIYLEEAQKG